MPRDSAASGGREVLDALQLTEEDIGQASLLLGFSVTGLVGTVDAASRRDILTTFRRIDVEACPGSGKTTLLVGKLAAIATKWKERTRGMCVLSHTNAARHQIERRLGYSEPGNRLLSYPHFIGTIHGFAAEFLALPWLRSCGYPVKMLDTDVCEARRWRKLANGPRIFFRKKHVGAADIRIVDAKFNVEKKRGAMPCAKTTDSCLAFQRACEATALEGYHCYDDLFVWAEDLIENVPAVLSAIRDRFPIVFIDEAQDNSEIQSALIRRIFTEGGGEAVLQRFGDMNQAIFDFAGAEEASTDVFPDDTVRRDLPISYRFGQAIADLANPFGVSPQGLVGRGPPPSSLPGRENRDHQHTIFIFDRNSIDQVLVRYAQLLMTVFTQPELDQGEFTACGQVHTKGSSADAAKLPHDMSDYWPEYVPELARREPTPAHFSEYVLAGVRKSAAARNTHWTLESVATALLRLTNESDPVSPSGRGRYKHRSLVRRLEEHPIERGLYRELLEDVCLDRNPLTQDSWDNKWRRSVEAVADALSETWREGDQNEWFLEWGPDQNASVHEKQRVSQLGDNRFRYPTESPRVEIRVGSVHSMKGETHTASLVCDTFWHKHNLSDLLPWLLGDNRGWTVSNQKLQRERLKVHYVAMTRPSHLLCLAMCRDTLTDQTGRLDTDVLDVLQARGWQTVIL